MERCLARWIVSVCCIAAVPATTASAAGAGTAQDPRLVLLIVVDQLRGDLPLRHADRFGANGFRRFLDRGVWFTDAHYRHSTTYTATGHATIATGCAPRDHGIVGNDWYDTERRERVYAVQDATCHWLADEPSSGPSGTSPRNLSSTTIGDELVLASGGKSRVFAVSIKDRAAILCGGRLGSAFWYSKASGCFITSDYYRKAIPDWMVDLRRRDLAARYAGSSWSLLRARESYVAAELDDAAHEDRHHDYGTAFPHVFADAPQATYATLPATPMGDETTVAFVRELIDHEVIGRGAAPDLLAVSLSATDYIGHAFGPASLEYEDNLLRLDQTLAGLLDFVDDRIGLDRCLVVLTSDHGIDAIPEQVAHAAADRSAMAAAVVAAGVGRLNTKALIDALNQHLRGRFDIDRDLVIAFWNPSFYVDLEVVAALGLSREAVQRAMVDRLMSEPGVHRAFARADLLRGEVSDPSLASMVLRSFHAQRSGEVLLIQSPGWFLHPESDKYAAMHGSPWNYDTHVPVAFLAPGLTPQQCSRRVAPEDIVPTLAAWLAIPAPAAADGDVLAEVSRRH